VFAFPQCFVMRFGQHRHVKGAKASPTSGSSHCTLIHTQQVHAHVRDIRTGSQAGNRDKHATSCAFFSAAAICSTSFLAASSSAAFFAAACRQIPLACTVKSAMAQDRMDKNLDSDKVHRGKEQSGKEPENRGRGAEVHQ
jgi:hypothetical protein